MGNDLDDDSVKFKVNRYVFNRNTAPENLGLSTETENRSRSDEVKFTFFSENFKVLL